MKCFAGGAELITIQYLGKSISRQKARRTVRRFNKNRYYKAVDINYERFCLLKVTKDSLDNI